MVVCLFSGADLTAPASTAADFMAPQPDAASPPICLVQSSRSLELMWSTAAAAAAAAKRPAGGQLMTFGRSVYKALAHFGIDRATWPVLAANRATWQEAIHGSQLALTAGRPTRVAAAATNLRIGATLADARAGVWDIGASITHSFALSLIHI